MEYTVHQQGANWIVKRNSLHPIPPLLPNEASATLFKQSLEHETELLCQQVADLESELAQWQGWKITSRRWDFG
jgi:hypothetical protein